jgi:hypothetical protein
MLKTSQKMVQTGTRRNASVRKKFKMDYKRKREMSGDVSAMNLCNTGREQAAELLLVSSAQNAALKQLNAFVFQSNYSEESRRAWAHAARAVS